MNSRNYCLLSAKIFALVAIAHGVRPYQQWPMQLGPLTIAPAVSWLGLILAGALSAWGLRAVRR